MSIYLDASFAIEEVLYAHNKRMHRSAVTQIRWVTVQAIIFGLLAVVYSTAPILGWGSWAGLVTAAIYLFPAFMNLYLRKTWVKRTWKSARDIAETRNRVKKLEARWA